MLAFDIALITGWARRVDDRIEFGTRDFSEYDYDTAVAARMMRGWFAEMMGEYEPSEIVIEQPFFHPKHPLTGARLYCLVHECHRAAELRGISRREYTPLEIKKFAVGRAYKVSKDDMIEAVRGMGHNIQDDHQADAVALLLLHEQERKL